MIKAVRVAFIAAIVLGLVQLLDALSAPLLILYAMIYAAAAVGLWRGNVWCGFGPALWFASQLCLVAVVMITEWGAVQENDELLGGLVFWG